MSNTPIEQSVILNSLERQGQCLTFTPFISVLIQLTVVLFFYTNKMLVAQDDLPDPNIQIDNWYTARERSHIQELMRPKTIDLKAATSLKLQFEAVNKNQGTCQSPNLSQEIDKLPNNPGQQQALLPELVRLPKSEFPGEQIMFMKFAELLEQQSRGVVRFQGDQFVLINSPSPWANIESSKITGNLAEVARLGLITQSEKKPVLEENLPGRITQQLHWQFEPRVTPLRILWKADDQSWYVNNISMSHLDQGATYENNVSAQHELIQNLNFILPHLQRNQKLPTKLKGTANVIIAWGELDFHWELIPSINGEKTNQFPINIGDRISIHDGKFTGDKSQSYLLEFTVQMPPALQLNTADIGLIKPKLKAATPEQTGANGIIAVETSIKENFKIIEEEIDAITNKIRWKYEFTMGNKQLTPGHKEQSLKENGKKEHNPRINISIPYYITRHSWNYETTMFLDP